MEASTLNEASTKIIEPCSTQQFSTLIVVTVMQFGRQIFLIYPYHFWFQSINLFNKHETSLICSYREAEFDALDWQICFIRIARLLTCHTPGTESVEYSVAITFGIGYDVWRLQFSSIY